MTTQGYLGPSDGKECMIEGARFIDKGRGGRCHASQRKEKRVKNRGEWKVFIVSVLGESNIKQDKIQATVCSHLTHSHLRKSFQRIWRDCW